MREDPPRAMLVKVRETRVSDSGRGNGVLCGQGVNCGVTPDHVTRSASA